MNALNTENRTRFSCVETAKLIRKQLKLKFPATKFSVKSSQYSMGASIDVCWTDGPTSKSVDDVVGGFAGAGFNGMEDYKYYVDSWLMPDGSVEFAHCKEYCIDRAGKSNPQPHPDAVLVHFGADYVFTRREYSESFLNVCVDEYEKQWDFDDDVKIEIEVSSYGNARVACALSIEQQRRFNDIKTAMIIAPPSVETPQPDQIALGVTIEQHTHTKRGFEMWIVCLADRVSRERYLELLAMAKSLGGWYSRKWGNTPAGFAFKDESKAREFAASLGLNPPSVETDRPPTQTPQPVDLSEKLEKFANSMQSSIDAKRGERRTNTPRQRQQAAHARQDADNIERAQSGLMALAALHKSGNVPAILASVKTKKEALDLGRERFDNSNRGYYDIGLPTGKPAEDSDKARAFWALIAPKTPEQIKADEIADLEMKIANGYKIEGYFPTPVNVIERMIDAVDLRDGQTVLEPSAGCGRIAEAVRERGATVTCIEVNGRLCDLLRLKGFDVIQDEFESHGKPCDNQFFDRVIMNPPFERGQDCDHVRLAFEALKPDGQLVAIMSPSFQFRQQAKFVSFREWLETVTYEVEKLPSGSFKSSGTGVETVMLTISK